MFKIAQSELNFLWKERLGILLQRKPSWFFRCILVILILAGLVTLYVNLYSIESSLLFLRLLLLSCGIYIVINLAVYFFLKFGRMPKRNPFLRAWLYRAADVVSLIYISALFFDISLYSIRLSGFIPGIISIVMTALIFIYLFTGVILIIFSPSIIQRKFQKSHSIVRLSREMRWAIAFPSSLSGLGAVLGMSLTRTGHFRLAYMIGSGLSFLIAYAILTISTVYLYELILLALNKIPVRKSDIEN